MLKLTRKFTVHTAVLISVLFLQLGGFLSGINNLVESSLPLIDTPLVRIMTAVGDGTFVLIFVLFVVFLDLKQHGKVSKETVTFLLAALFGLLIVGVLKILTAEPRPRPLPGANVLSEGAFPSGHTFRAAIMASYVSDRWRKLAPMAWICALTVGLTRLLLHYHWFSDVLFSLILAPWIYDLAKLTDDLWLPLYRAIITKLGLEVLDVE